MKRSLALLLAVSCHHEVRPPAPPEAPVLVPAWMDPSANPCEDFYQYVCGGWLKANPLPPDRPFWANFLETDHSEEVVGTLLERDAIAPDERDPGAQQLGAFFGGCQDEAQLAKATPAALLPELALIDAVTDARTLARAVARQHLLRAQPLFTFFVTPDLHDTSQMELTLAQGGLGIGTRSIGGYVDDSPDYYLKDDKDDAAVRAAYVTHVAAMLRLAGAHGEDAARVVAFETLLAAGHLSNADQTDPAKQDHPVKLTGLHSAHFDWEAYFAALGGPVVERLNVAWPPYFDALEAALARTPLADVRAYLKFMLVHTWAPELPQPFRDENAAFFAKTLGGAAPPPRARECQQETSWYLPDLVGHAYVRRAFDEKARDEARTVIREVERAFEARVRAASWMDEPTRAAALAKLARVGNEAGYPDAWPGWQGLRVDRAELLRSAFSAAETLQQRQLAWLGKPTDRAAVAWRWYSPQDLGAVYDTQLLTMIFPAAILQPPLFVPGTGPANQATVGWVAGHELTHGFDSGGRRYDADGKLRDWWSASSAKAYDERAQCFVDQYSAFEALPGLHVDGKSSLNENIADNGALRMSWDAWRAGRAGKPALPRVAGLDEDQQFFVAASQGCAAATEQFLRAQVKTSPHVWWNLRAVVPAMNLPEFSKAFSCKPGSAMSPAKRCTLW